MGQETKRIKFCDRCKKEVDSFWADIRIRAGHPADTNNHYETIEFCHDCNVEFFNWFNDPRLKK